MSGGRLDGKVCVITGAAGGIGEVSADCFADEGATVVGVDLADEGPGELYRRVDVTEGDAVAELYEEVTERFGGIDVLFNNAGVSPREDAGIAETDLQVWERVIAINLTGVFHCCKHGIAHLQRRGGGSIINTASFVATMGAATSQIGYTASKGGVLAMSRELGVQYAREGIRVNALCPGPVSTPLLEELYSRNPEEAERRLLHIPAGRFGEASEIAAAAVFLASDESSYMTASTFLVDGGISAAYVTPE